MTEYVSFKMTLKHLELQYINYQTLDPGFPPLVREGVAESVIHRFKICYHCLWTVLKRYLQEERGLPSPPSSPKPIFRLANENQ